MPPAESGSLAPSEESYQNSRQSSHEGTLLPVERKIIEFFVQVTKLLAIPKSVGEIYGLLYCSSRPLAVADMTAKLGLSKATASYALRFLADINAISLTKEFGERQDRFLAETSLRKVASGFVSERLDPFLRERQADLEILEALGEAMPDQTPQAEQQKHFVMDRIQKLEGWQRSFRRALPLLHNFFKMAS